MDRDEDSSHEPRWATVARRFGLISAVALAVYLGAYGSLRLGGYLTLHLEGTMVRHWHDTQSNRTYVDGLAARRRVRPSRRDLPAAELVDAVFRPLMSLEDWIRRPSRS